MSEAVVDARVGFRNVVLRGGTGVGRRVRGVLWP